MKNHILYILLLSLSILFAGETTSRKVGPGTIYYKYVDKNAPLSIHIMEIDITNPNIELISQKANSKLSGLQKTSVMAQQMETAGHNVISAINADFFHKDGKPIGIQIADGVMVKNPYSRSVFGITEKNKPFIDILEFDGTVFTNNKSCKIDAVNSYRQDDELILFNNYIGVTNKTNKWGVEVVANYIGEPCVNDTSYLIVIDKDNSIEDDGNKDVPGYGVILSAHGTKGEFLKNSITIGDTLKILLTLPPTKGKIIEAVGGVPQIIQNGRIKIDTKKENIPESFSTTRHPRTAIGFNRKRDRIYMFVVDGRQSEHSIGMSLRELAKFMLNWGVYEGINLDGGGSTAMFVRGEIVNRPSDSTGERLVSNALMVLCKNKSGETEYLNLLPTRVKVPKSQSFQFRTVIFDEYFNPLSKEKIKWSCSHNLGTIDMSGKFKASNRSHSGYIYIESDTKKDSSYVIIQ